MSIILRALKKVQEQEVGQSDGLSSGEMPPGDATAPVASSTPVQHRTRAASSEAGSRRPVQPHIAAIPAAPRHSFGTGLKVLLGLLVVLGIATTGWFVSRIYLNLQMASEIAKEQAPDSAGETIMQPEAETTPAVPSEPAIPESAPAPASAVAAERRAPQPEATVVAAVVQPPIPSASLARPASLVEQPSPAAPPVVIEVPPVKLPEPPHTPPAIKEAKPQKTGRPEFKINAIAWQNAEPRAIVNMQRVYEGDVIEGATVLAIKRKVVVFEYEGEIFEVRF